ncbi:MAG: acyl-CoA dehydrogenase family protein [Acetobacteraceae bacterium]|nr:acyl-CoA dehydrogenase family protein [Acetobacteraceae bacterium]
MPVEPSAPGYATHEVLNQAGPFEAYNAFAGDLPLHEATRVFGADWAAEHLSRTGALIGSTRLQLLARQANRYVPELRTHDRFGNRIDEVEFHPAYHELMALIFGSEEHSFAWTHPQPGAQVARGVLSYLWNQGENGVCCPASMTFAAIPPVKNDRALYATMAPLILSSRYDPRPIPAEGKTGITVGMAMTEKQGGSDLRATLTHARPAGSARGPSAPYLLTGHKWFFSVPMSDLFLTLARTESGISCFAARGWLPDGARNRLKLQRLKEKCGNRSNASSEVEFYDLEATMLGEEGRGIRTIIGMAQLTRLDISFSAAGIMRQALSQAIHHTSHRRAFQRALIDQPLMRAVLADLATESEAMIWLCMRVAWALDRFASDPAEALLSRVCIPLAKYWTCKRAPGFIAEALDCHGGNGFIAEHPLERLYREAPLNGIWEGSANVICLDVLRAMQQEPEAVGAFLDEVRRARGADPRLDAAAAELERSLTDLSQFEGDARRLAEMMVNALQGSLLLRYSAPAVADAFCSTRLAGGWGRVYGTLPHGCATQEIVDRARIVA